MQENEQDKKYQQLTLRVTVSLHEKLKLLAEKEKTTLNQLCLYLLSYAIAKIEDKKIKQ